MFLMVSGKTGGEKQLEERGREGERERERRDTKTHTGRERGTERRHRPTHKGRVPEGRLRPQVEIGLRGGWRPGEREGEAALRTPEVLPVPRSGREASAEQTPGKE